MTAQTRKNLTLNLPCFGVGTLSFGIAAEDCADRARQYTAFVKFFGGKAKFRAEEIKHLAGEQENSAVVTKRLGLQPKNSGTEIRIFTFGLFVLKIDSRIRAGFIKRRQVLVEA